MVRALLEVQLQCYSDRHHLLLLHDHKLHIIGHFYQVYVALLEVFLVNVFLVVRQPVVITEFSYILRRVKDALIVGFGFVFVLRILEIHTINFESLESLAVFLLELVVLCLLLSFLALDPFGFLNLHFFHGFLSFLLEAFPLGLLLVLLLQALLEELFVFLHPAYFHGVSGRNVQVDVGERVFLGVVVVEGALDHNALRDLVDKVCVLFGIVRDGEEFNLFENRVVEVVLVDIVLFALVFVQKVLHQFDHHLFVEHRQQQFE